MLADSATLEEERGLGRAQAPTKRRAAYPE
jgi:hypothetical protein